jgi:phenylalanyl-tRNA synthetase beta chain
MLISARWLLALLDAPASMLPTYAEAQEHLIHAGFPIESRTELPSGDLQLDVEITSNRGDCISHLGLARELGARLGVGAAPDPRPVGAIVEDGPAQETRLEVRVAPALCPRFLVRVVRGVRVGPSPAWLRERLEAVGQRSISNVVDATNYLSLEMGNPCHAFDAAKISGGLTVRMATQGEVLATLDGKARTLTGGEAGDVVVADAQRAQSLAGVIGGATSQVTDATTDVILEVATWDPATVRRTARRQGIRTDASHRFERLVDARTLDTAIDRLATLVQMVAGGQIARGVIASAPAPAPTRVTLRPQRVAQILGVEIQAGAIAQALGALGIEVGPIGRGGDGLLCTVPAHRPDLTREIDLIEEVARVRGLDAIPLHDQVGVHVRGPQASEGAMSHLAGILTGLGFFEATTFSFSSESAARAFATPGLEIVKVEQARAADPALRTSVLPGLLGSRRANQHARVSVAGGVRLFETASTFALAGPGGTGQGDALAERRTLALLLDVPGEGKKRSVADKQLGVRLVRGALEELARGLGGRDASLDIEPAAADVSGFDADVFGFVLLRGARIGRIGLASASMLREFEIELPVAMAEVELGPLIAAYPPRAQIAALPAFPEIERDISLIVGEGVTWREIDAAIGTSQTPRLESADFVTTFRGGQIGKGKKSVTVRLRFRDASRTLTHEEVDAPVAALVQRLGEGLGATLRLA